MIPKVYNLKEQKEEKVRFFDLRYFMNQPILVGVDRDGEWLSSGNILTINPDGTITLSKNVGEGVGLKTDDNGRVIIKNSF